MIEGLEQTFLDTRIWLKDNHTAMDEGVKTAHEDLSKKHPGYGEKVFNLLEAGDVKT